MQITATDTVNAPIDRVFEVFSDVANCGERISGISAVEVLSDVTSGVGVRWRETRTVFGKEATEEMWMTACDPPNSYVVESESNGTKYLTTFTFERVDDNTTRVSWIFGGTPVSLKAKLLTPLAFLFKGALVKMMMGDITDLKAHIEAQG